MFMISDLATVKRPSPATPLRVSDRIPDWLHDLAGQRERDIFNAWDAAITRHKFFTDAPDYLADDCETIGSHSHGSYFVISHDRQEIVG